MSGDVASDVETRGFDASTHRQIVGDGAIVKVEGIPFEVVDGQIAIQVEIGIGEIESHIVTLISDIIEIDIGLIVINIGLIDYPCAVVHLNHRIIVENHRQIGPRNAVIVEGLQTFLA